MYASHGLNTNPIVLNSPYTNHWTYVCLTVSVSDKSSRYKLKLRERINSGNEITILNMNMYTMEIYDEVKRIHI